MSLSICLISCRNLPGSFDRIAKIRFRDQVRHTKVSTNCYDAEWNEIFQFDVDPLLKQDEFIEIEVYNYYKVLRNRKVGRFCASTRTLSLEKYVKYCENLVDDHHGILESKVDVEMIYNDSLLKLANRHEDIVESNLKSHKKVDAEFISVLEMNSPLILHELGKKDLGSIIASYHDPLLEDVVIEHFSKIQNESFQLQIMVVGAAELIGQEISPYCEVTVGSEKKTTPVRSDTTNPTWNTLFILDYSEIREFFLRRHIVFKVFSKNYLLKKDLLLGQLVIDFYTIFTQPLHAIQNKWFYLHHPHDVSPVSEPQTKGFLKLSLTILSDQETVFIPPVNPDLFPLSKENIFSPYPSHQENFKLKIIVNVFRCEGLFGSKSEFDIEDFFLNKVINSSFYVTVSFGGQEGKTSTQKFNSEGVWNDSITFYAIFPPMHQIIMFKIWEKYQFKDILVASHALKIQEICSSDVDGHIPTFGPSWINFYGIVDQLNVLENEYMNDAIDQSLAFKGKLLVSINSGYTEKYEETTKLIKSEKTDPLKEKFEGPLTEYCLFAQINSVDMINVNYEGQKAQITAHFGYYKQMSDEQREKYVQSTQNVDDEDTTVNNLISKGSLQTTPTGVIATSQHYAKMDMKQTKFCLSASFLHSDQCWRIYQDGIFDKITCFCYESIRKFRSLNRKTEFQQLAIVIITFMYTVKEFSRWFLMKFGTTPVMKPQNSLNQLEILRFKKKCKALENIQFKFAECLLDLKSIVNAKECLNLMRETWQLFKNLSQKVQHTMPDLFIWLKIDKLPVGVHRIPIESIIFSKNSMERGWMCGKPQTFFFRIPRGRCKNINYWDIVGKANAIIWIGKEKFTSNLLASVFTESSSAIDSFQMPTEIVTTHETTFMLRVFMFQARDLVAADEAGVADPSAVVYCHGHSTKTNTLWETKSPQWNQTLIIPLITIYDSWSNIMKNPPLIGIDLLDQDEANKFSLMGRAFTRPTIISLSQQTISKAINEPLVSTEKVFLGGSTKGELLFSCQLIQYDPLNVGCLPDSLRNMIKAANKSLFIPIPDHVQPRKKKCRIEILFWGLRNIKESILKSSNKFMLTVEYADQTIKKEFIENYEEYKNFKNIYSFIDVELAEDDKYCAPLSFKIFQCKSYGRNILIGCCTLNNINSLRMKQEEKVIKTDRKEEEVHIGEVYVEPKTETTTKPDMMDVSDKEWWHFYFQSKSLKKFEVVKTDEDSMQSQDLIDTQSFDTVFSSIYRDGNEVKQPIKIFPTELESISIFENFNDKFISIELCKGPSDDSSNEKDENPVVAITKGNVRIWNHPVPSHIMHSPVGSFDNLPSPAPIEAVLRVYVVRALNLHPSDDNGMADPYLRVRVGNQEVNDVKNYIPNQLSPLFGRTFSFQIELPRDNIIRISVYDHDRFGSDDLIGETSVELEDRFFSKHLLNCGISDAYNTTGLFQWRNSLRPSQLLMSLCKSYNVASPELTFGRCKIGSYVFHSIPFIVDEKGAQKDSAEPAALKALQNFHLIPESGFYIVPEHIETRSLYNNKKHGMSQGELEMWVEMFPINAVPSQPLVDISVKKPIEYELRVTVWNTEEVPLSDVDVMTGEKSSDIYLTGWMEGQKEDEQKTDVHKHSLSGEGNFNWRLIYRFFYSLSEDKIVVTKKTYSMPWDLSEEKLPPKFHLQVWDYDLFTPNQYLGSMSLKLSNMPIGSKSSKSCSLNLVNSNNNRFVNLFKINNMRGWFPFEAKSPDTNQSILAGKVDLEFQLLTVEEATKAPAGKGRNEPQALPAPNRPDNSISWLMYPIFLLYHILWLPYQRCVGKYAVMLLLTLILGIFLYTLPSALVGQIIN